jgi:hypothetical protein
MGRQQMVVLVGQETQIQYLGLVLLMLAEVAAVRTVEPAVLAVQVVAVLVVITLQQQQQLLVLLT